jgi:ribonuclease T2
MIKLALLLAALAVAQPALAQPIASCQVPDTIAAPPVAVADGPVRRLPVTHYVLALTWAPDFCDTHSGEADTDLECRDQAAQFGFVLHGLWPDAAPVAGQATWPQWCPAQAPATAQVPAEIARSMLCLTPSAGLIAHEWAKHGTCMSPSAQIYFGQSAALFRALHFPDMAALARRSHLTAGDFRDAFAQANPRYPRQSIAPVTGKGVSLQEVHLCLNREFHPAACPEPGMLDSAAIRIIAPR